MPMYTILGSEEKDIFTSNDELNAALIKVRNITGEDWQVRERIIVKKRFLRKTKEYRFIQLLVADDTTSMYRVIIGANTIETCIMYLYGVVSGIHHNESKSNGQ